MKRITLIISGITAGGAERVMSIMANYWAAHGVKVTLITLADDSIPPFYDLDSRINVVPLGIAQESGSAIIAATMNLKRMRRLRNAIRASSADSIISFITETNVLVCLASIGLGRQLIISERTEPSMEYPGRIWSLLRRLTYPLATNLVLVSEYARNFFSGSVRESAIVIPNPILKPVYDNVDTPLIPKPSVLAMGRFDHQKGFDLLLQAFSRVSKKYPEWSLTILGDGPLRPYLEDLSASMGLGSKVSMPGVVINPFNYLNQGEIFVLSSRFEGFPNALCEAMASGLAVISFDCKTGPAEIIRDGIDGLLVPAENLDELANAIERVIGDKVLRKTLQSNAPSVMDRYGLDKIMAMWSRIAHVR